MYCVGMDDWETNIKGKAPYGGLGLCAFYIEVLTKDSSKFSELGVPRVMEASHNFVIITG